MKHIPILLALAIALPLCAAERLRVTDDHYAWRAFMLQLQQSEGASPPTNHTGTPSDVICITNTKPSIIYSNDCAVINVDVMTTFTFSLLTTNCEVVTVTNQTPQRLDGRFWLEWVVETNTSPRRTMEGFDRYWDARYLTNLVYDALCVTNVLWWQQPQPEPTEGTETYYVSSNLWFHVVWRGRTNSDCLESIPVRTETRKWKMEQKKVYTP